MRKKNVSAWKAACAGCRTLLVLAHQLAIGAAACLGAGAATGHSAIGGGAIGGGAIGCGVIGGAIIRVARGDCSTEKGNAGKR